MTTDESFREAAPAATLNRTRQNLPNPGDEDGRSVLLPEETRYGRGAEKSRRFSRLRRAPNASHYALARALFSPGIPRDRAPIVFPTAPPLNLLFLLAARDAACDETNPRELLDPNSAHRRPVHSAGVAPRSRSNPAGSSFPGRLSLSRPPQPLLAYRIRRSAGCTLSD